MIVSDSSAAFDGPYGEKPARCIVSRFIEILMIRPQRPRSIGRTAARAIRNGPLMLVSIIDRQADASASQKRVGSVMKLLLIYFMPRPALLTRMSRLPNRARAASTTRSQSSSRVTSATSG